MAWYIKFSMEPDNQDNLDDLPHLETLSLDRTSIIETELAGDL